MLGHSKGLLSERGQNRTRFEETCFKFGEAHKKSPLLTAVVK